MCDSVHLKKYATLKQQAKKLIEKQEWISAFNTLIEMQEISPNNYKLLNKLGNIYEELENSHAAKWYYRKAINIEPHNDLAHYNLAKLYMKHKQHILSNQHFLRCIQIDDSKAATNFWYGQLLLKINTNISKALSYLIKAANIKPRIANYHYYIGKTALILNTSRNDIIANTHLTTAIEITNQNEIKYINEYVMHWNRWQWNDHDNLFSIRETMHYLYLYALNASVEVRKAYISLCCYLLKNAEQFDVHKNYMLRCIERALQFDSSDDFLLYEKYRILDEMKYGICNSDNIFSRKMITVKNHKCDCGDYEEQEQKAGKAGTLLVSNIVKNRCALITDAYISHNNLCIDESIIISNDVKCLCIRYLIGGEFSTTMSEIDRIGSELHFYDETKNEMIEMIFESVFPIKENKFIFIITKTLNYVDEILSSIECDHALKKSTITRRLNASGVFEEVDKYVPPTHCECKYKNLLLYYYILYLFLFTSITSFYYKLKKLDKTDDKYYNKLLFLPFKIICKSRGLFLCQGRDFIKVAFQFVTKVLMSHDQFYTIYCCLLCNDLFKIDVFTAIRRLYPECFPEINTMRYVVAPLLFIDEDGLNYKPKTVPTANLQLLEDLMFKKLNPYDYRSEYQIALYWWQLESKEIKYQNWNNISLMSKIMTGLYENLSSKVSNLNTYVLETFINQRVCLKPSEMSWNEFFRIIGYNYMARKYDILKPYFGRQMLEDKYNKHHWEHCKWLTNQGYTF
eukprot:555037_1